MDFQQSRSIRWSNRKNWFPAGGCDRNPLFAGGRHRGRGKKCVHHRGECFPHSQADHHPSLQ